MSFFKRCIFKSKVALAVLFLAGSLDATEVPGAGAATEPAALPELPDWMLTTKVGAAAGYRDNVLLSPANAVGSGFLRGEVEAMLLRVPVDGVDGYFFVNVIETRYFSAKQTDHERTAFLVSELRWQATETLKLNLLAQAYHHDQVFDVSTTEISLDTAVLKMTGANLAPGVRWNVTPDWWVEANAGGRRDSYDRDVDGYEEGEGRVRVGRTWGQGSGLSLGGARRWRSHNTREQFTPGGRPITGTLLKVRQSEVNARLEWVLDAAKHWRVTGSVLREENRDNGSGYFDFDRFQAAASLAWTRDPWDVRVSASAGEYEFPVQLVGIGITPESRRKEEWRTSVELARKLTASFDAFAFFETERSTSNDGRSQFRVSTGHVGVRWSWDQLARVLDTL